MNRIKQFWDNLRASFWFLPSLIVIGSIVLAVALVEIDSIGNYQWQARWPRLFGAGAEGSRGVLATIAGSMMTVVGITFSMTLMTLALASTQYTSRILQNFMRDRVTQFVLGIFAGIFTYCLIVTRSIRGGELIGFVPNISVLVGVILAIGGIGTLILFIHHIAYSIQASSIIAAVAEETIRAVDRLFPEKLGEDLLDDNDDPSVPERKWMVVPAAKSGYIQSVDNASLIRLARELATIVRMERGIGEFVIHGTPLVSIALKDSPEKEALADLRSAYNINRNRTVEQDAAFGIGQIVDMALRALSPGINDTTTAVMCVDYLTAILARLCSRDIPSSHRFEEGELRVIAIGPTFASLVAESFDSIRGSANGNTAILLRMLGAHQTLGNFTVHPNRRRVLLDNIQSIAELGERSIESPFDRAIFDRRLEEVRAAIEAESARQTGPSLTAAPMPAPPVRG